MSKVVKAVNLKSENVKFANNIKTNKYSGKTVFASHDGMPLRIQMPKMGLPFGVSKYINPDKPEEVKYSLELSFKDINPSLLSTMKEIEEKVINYAFENSKELFKKQKTKEVLKDSYRSFIKYSEDANGDINDKYAPRLKVKMYTEGSNFKLDAYDSEKVEGRYPRIHLNEENIEDYIAKGSRCETILQCSGIWVVGQSFGISWVIAQIKIYKNENQLSGYSFQEDDEEEEVEVEVESLSENLNDEVEEREEFDIPGEPEQTDEIEIKTSVKKPRRKREAF